MKEYMKYLKTLSGKPAENNILWAQASVMAA